MAKYDSCARAHRSQKGTPWISTTARRRQGRSVLLPTWHSPSFVASVFSKSSTTTVRVQGAGNAGAARSTTVNDAAGTVSLRHPFPAHPWAIVAHITNYTTLLLLVLLYAVFGTATSLPEKCWGPTRSPGKFAPHNYSRLHLREVTSSLALGTSTVVGQAKSRGRLHLLVAVDRLA